MDQVKSSDKVSIPFAEKLKGIPGAFGIRLGEEPQYEVIGEFGDIEVRHYDQQVWAQTTVQGDGEEAEEVAFKRLAGYIFGQNKSNEVSKMTVPVIQQSGADGLTMSFILSKEETGMTVPLPVNTDVVLKTIPERHTVCLRYSGKTDRELTKSKTAELLEWISAHPHYKVCSEAMSAQYDDPHVIPFLRRNEIHVDVLLMAFT